MSTEQISIELPPHGLTWAIKSSFIRYLGYLPDSTISLGGQAAMLPQGHFNFPLKPGAVDISEGMTRLDFCGEIKLCAHEGLLDIDFHCPSLLIYGDHATLQVKTGSCANSTGHLDLCAAFGGIFESAGSDLLWSSQDVQLCPEAITMFGSQYPSGTAMDPLAARIPIPA